MNDKSSIAINNDKQPQIFPAKDMRVQQILMGAIFLIFGIIGPKFFIPIGILGVIVAFICKYDQYVTLGNDFITIRAPIGTKKEILFDEINSITNYENKKITIMYTLAGTNKVKKGIILLNSIAEPNKSDLIKAISQLDENRKHRA